MSRFIFLHSPYVFFFFSLDKRFRWRTKELSFFNTHYLICKAPERYCMWTYASIFRKSFHFSFIKWTFLCCYVDCIDNMKERKEMKLKSLKNAFCQNEVQRKWLFVRHFIYYSLWPYKTFHQKKEINYNQKIGYYCLLFPSNVTGFRHILFKWHKENVLLRTATLHLKFQKRHLIDIAKVQAVLAPSYYS